MCTLIIFNLAYNFILLFYYCSIWVMATSPSTPDPTTAPSDPATTPSDPTTSTSDPATAIPDPATASSAPAATTLTSGVSEYIHCGYGRLCPYEMNCFAL